MILRRPAGPIAVLDRLAVPGMTLVGVLYGLAAVGGIVPLPGDAWINWVAPPGTYLGPGQYVYTPVLTQLLEPLRWVDAWQLYTVLWMALCFGSLGYVLGPLSYVAALLVIPDVLLGGSNWWAGPIEAVLLGNVTMPMVAAIVAGMRDPGWWSVPLLTKVTPGIGLGWYAFRGEWRRFAIGLGITAAIVAVSVLLSPEAWREYVSFLTANLVFVGANDATVNLGPALVGPPLMVRLPVAALVLLFAARTNRAWIVPIACAIALTGLYGWATFASVASGTLSPRLWGAREVASTGSDDPVVPVTGRTTGT